MLSALRSPARTVARPAARRSSRRPPEWWRLFALTLVAVPPAVLLVDLLRQPAAPIYLSSDFGLIAMATREAARGVRLLGPWSRFGWNHPGPAYFYVLAPFYQAAGARALGLYAGVVVLNAAAALTVVAVVARRAGTRAGVSVPPWSSCATCGLWGRWRCATSGTLRW
jgi:hypothetical protein